MENTIRRGALDVVEKSEFILRQAREFETVPSLGGLWRNPKKFV